MRVFIGVQPLPVFIDDRLSQHERAELLPALHVALRYLGSPQRFRLQQRRSVDDGQYHTGPTRVGKRHNRLRTILAHVSIETLFLECPHIVLRYPATISIL